MSIRATNTAYKSTPSLTTKPKWGDNVVAFDLDNLYPDRIYQNVIQSGTAWAATQKFGRFLRGDGFHDKNFNRAIVNYRRDSVKTILRKAAADYALYQGFALWISYNGMMEVDAVYNVPFKYVRACMPDSDGYIAHYAISDNWAYDNYLPNKMMNPLYLNAYDPSESAVAAQMEQAGGINEYGGQLYYCKGDFDIYPLAWLDPVIDAVAVDREIPAFQRQAIETNFMASHYLTLPYEFADQDQRYRFEEAINEFQGSRNAGKVMYIENANPEYKVGIEKVEQQDWDKKFQVTEQAVRDRIFRCLGQSPVLHGVATAGSLGAAKEVEDAFTVYNQQTQDDRATIEEAFADIFSRFYADINPTGDYEIKALEFTAKTDSHDILPTNNAGGSIGGA